MSEDLQKQLTAMGNELLDRYEELSLLYDLGASLAPVLDLEESCALAVAKAAETIAADKAIVALSDDEGVLYAAAVFGTDRLSAGGITEHVARTGRQVLLHQSEPPPAGATRDDTDDGSVLSVPLLSPGAGELLGALTLARRPGAAVFTAGDAKLAGAVATQLAAAVYRSRLVESLNRTEAIRREIELAAGIQRTLLPAAPPVIAGADLAALCESAAKVGGDYYDFFVDRSGRLSLVIADVAGHSIGSALMMAMARSILRRELGEEHQPAEVLRATNASLFGDLVRAGLFFTVFCARFDPGTGVLEYANGGHNPPMIRRVDGGTEWLDADGAAIGILADVQFEARSSVLEPGDTLLLYTDGVTESASPHGDQFGEAGLQDVAGGGAEGLVASVYAAARRHTAGTPQADDITLVALRALERT